MACYEDISNPVFRIYIYKQIEKCSFAKYIIFEILEIDGSLIKNIDVSNESKTIVKSIINMSKDLNAKTVAEYIHSKDVYEITKSLGVDFLQGFYLGGESQEFNFYFPK